MKLLDIIKAANRNLLKNKLRTFLTILAIFIGSFTIILNTAINAGVNSFIDQQVENLGGEGFLQIMNTSTLENMGMDISGSNGISQNTEIKEYQPDPVVSGISILTSEDLDKIRAVDGVKQVFGFMPIEIEYITSEKTDKKYQINAEILPTDSLNLDVLTGQAPDTSSSDYQIFLPSGYAEKLGFSSDNHIVGKTVSLTVKQTAKCYITPDDCLATIDATVVGTAAPGLWVQPNTAEINPALNYAILDLINAGMPDTEKDQYFAATADVDPEKVKEIQEKLLDLGFASLSIDDQAGFFRIFFDAILIVFNLFGAIALLAASIGIINTLFMSVKERTREIGLMKAMGLSNAKVFLSFSFEAIALGFWGSVVGIIASMVIGHVINYVAHSTFLSDFPTFQLAKFDPVSMIIIVLIIMFIAFLAGTLPARRASRQDPIEALRYE